MIGQPVGRNGWGGVPAAQHRERPRLYQWSRDASRTCPCTAPQRTKAVALADGSIRIARVGEEKGIGVRIALDVLNGGYRRESEQARNRQDRMNSDRPSTPILHSWRIVK